MFLLSTFSMFIISLLLLIFSCTTLFACKVICSLRVFFSFKGKVDFCARLSLEDVNLVYSGSASTYTLKCLLALIY